MQTNPKGRRDPYFQHSQKATRTQDVNSLEELVPLQELHSQIDPVVELSQDDFSPTCHELIM